MNFEPIFFSLHHCNIDIQNQNLNEKDSKQDIFEHMILLVLILSAQQRAGVPERSTLDTHLGDLCHDLHNGDLFYGAKQYLKNISESCMGLSGVQKAVSPSTVAGC